MLAVIFFFFWGGGGGGFFRFFNGDQSHILTKNRNRFVNVLSHFVFQFSVFFNRLNPKLKEVH